MDEGFEDTVETLDTNFGYLYDDFDFATNELVQGFEDLNGGIKSVDDNFVYYQNGTIQTIGQFEESFRGYASIMADLVLQGFSDTAVELVKGFGDVNGGIVSFNDTYVTYADGTTQWLTDYQSEFSEYVKDEAYVNDYGNLGTENSNAGNDSAEDTIGGGVDEVTNKFNFYGDVVGNVNDMVNVITSVDSTQKYYINVSCKWFSGQVCVVDLSWYAPYKELGDNIICIFCYLTFLWNIFLRLPDIINGAGASSYSGNMIGDINTYKKTGFGRSSSPKNRGF